MREVWRTVTFSQNVIVFINTDGTFIPIINGSKFYLTDEEKDEIHQYYKDNYIIPEPIIIYKPNDLKQQGIAFKKDGGIFRIPKGLTYNDKYPESEYHLASKYRSIKKIVDDISFDSRKEADFYVQLKLRKRSRDIKDFELQPIYHYHIAYTCEVNQNMFAKNAFYKADFKIIHNDGSEEIIDCKGFKTDVYKQKKKIVEALYGIKIIEK